MKTMLAALVLTVTSTSAFAAPSVLEALQPRAGLYELSANDQANPCLGSYDLKEGKEARLNVFQAPEANEYQEKGDVIVQLEQYGDNIDKWYSLFDRSSFFRINGWSKRFLAPLMGLWITHKSTYNDATGVLQHSSSMSNLTGSQAGIQTIQFNDAEKKFVYTYDIVDYNAFGSVTKTQPAGRCEFSKKD
jgi:hypothetical protein